MKLIRIPTMAAILACLALFTQAQAQSEFEEYPAGLPGLGYASFFVDVSGDGRAILGRETLPSNSAYIVEGGASTFLSQGNYVQSVPRQISADGRVVVGTGLDPGDAAIYWLDGAGPFELAAPAGASRTSASAVDGDGSVIAGSGVFATGSQAIRWVDGVPSIIDPPQGASSVHFGEISPDGSHMVGELGFSPDPPFAQAVRWSTSGGYTMLDFPVGAYRTFANGQSADGQLTIGTAWLTSGDRRAVAWDGTGALIELHDPAWSDSFGIAVDAAGTKVLLTAFLLTGVGGTYLYDFSTGQATPLVDLLTQTGGPSLPFEEVVNPVALSADGSTAVGNFFGDPFSSNYMLWGARINSFGKKVCGPALGNSTGVGASLLGSGSLSVSSNTGSLTATLLPPGAFGMFLTSQTLQPSTIQGTGATLCLGGNIGRFNGPGQIGVSDAAGTLPFDLDLGALPQPMGSVAALPGQTWYFQAWFRDNNPMPTSNLSDALEVMLTQ